MRSVKPLIKSMTPAAVIADGHLLLQAEGFAQLGLLPGVTLRSPESWSATCPQWIVASARAGSVILKG
jgi:hypothetical protein